MSATEMSNANLASPVKTPVREPETQSKGARKAAKPSGATSQRANRRAAGKAQQDAGNAGKNVAAPRRRYTMPSDDEEEKDNSDALEAPAPVPVRSDWSTLSTSPVSSSHQVYSSGSGDSGMSMSLLDLDAETRGRQDKPKKKPEAKDKSHREAPRSRSKKPVAGRSRSPVGTQAQPRKADSKSSKAQRETSQLRPKNQAAPRTKSKKATKKSPRAGPAEPEPVTARAPSVEVASVGTKSTAEEAETRSVAEHVKEARQPGQSYSIGPGRPSAQQANIQAVYIVRECMNQWASTPNTRVIPREGGSPRLAPQFVHGRTAETIELFHGPNWLKIFDVIHVTNPLSPRAELYSVRIERLKPIEQLALLLMALFEAGYSFMNLVPPALAGAPDLAMLAPEEVYMGVQEGMLTLAYEVEEWMRFRGTPSESSSLLRPTHPTGPTFVDVNARREPRPVLSSSDDSESMRSAYDSTPSWYSSEPTAPPRPRHVPAPASAGRATPVPPVVPERRDDVAELGQDAFFNRNGLGGVHFAPETFVDANAYRFRQPTVAPGHNAQQPPIVPPSGTGFARYAPAAAQVPVHHGQAQPQAQRAGSLPPQPVAAPVPVPHAFDHPMTAPPPIPTLPQVSPPVYEPGPASAFPPNTAYAQSKPTPSRMDARAVPVPPVTYSVPSMPYSVPPTNPPTMPPQSAAQNAAQATVMVAGAAPQAAPTVFDPSMMMRPFIPSRVLDKFDGLDSIFERRFWFEEYRYLATAGRWTDDEKIRYLKMYLRGAARAWLNQLTAAERSSWRSMSDAFEREFCTEKDAPLEKYFLTTQRRNETPLQHLWRLNAAARKARVPLSSAPDLRRHIDRFIKTLTDDSVRQTLSGKTFRSLDEVSDALKSWERHQPRREERSRSSRSSSRDREVENRSSTKAGTVYYTYDSDSDRDGYAQAAGRSVHFEDREQEYDSEYEPQPEQVYYASPAQSQSKPQGAWRSGRPSPPPPRAGGSQGGRPGQYQPQLKPVGGQTGWSAQQQQPNANVGQSTWSGQQSPMPIDPNKPAGCFKCGSHKHWARECPIKLVDTSPKPCPLCEEVHALPADCVIRQGLKAMFIKNDAQSGGSAAPATATPPLN